MKKLKKLFAAALLGAIGMLGAGEAKADFVPVLTSITGSSGAYTFNYLVHLGASEKANLGHMPVNGDANVATSADYFTIYDFQGLVSGSESISSLTPGYAFSFIESPTDLGITPPDIAISNPPDSPTIPNVTAYLTLTPGIPLSADAFFVLSIKTSNTTNLVTNGKFSSLATSPSGGKDQNVGPVYVPLENGVPLPTPTPAAFGGGAVVLGLAAMGRRRRA